MKNISKTIEKEYYDPKLRGLDWDALTEQTLANIRNANSASEMFTALYALVNSFQDSHTVFMPPGRAVRHLFGFEVKAYGSDIRVYEVDEEGAAYAAGLRRGDRVLGINGFRADRQTIDLMMLFFRRLLPVMVMEITYDREGGEPQTVRIEGVEEREALITDLTKIDNIYWLIRENQSAREPFHTKVFDDDIGYLELPYFTRDERFVHSLVKKVRDTRATIIDLRGNHGGAVTALEYFAGFFEPEETQIAILQGRKKDKPIEVKPQKPQVIDRPMVILVDSQSASAAEIFAYHFQSTGRAVVVGDRSSGQVTAARLFEQNVGGDVVVTYWLQVTTSRVVFPRGEELEGVGVEPDHLCIPGESDLRDGNDPCLDLAIELAKEKAGVPTETASQ